MPRMRGRECSWAIVVFAMCARSAHAASGDPGESAPRGADQPTHATGSGNHISEFFYLTPEVGAQYVGLETLHLTRELLPSQIHTADVGPVVGVAAGFRLFFVTLGPRFRFGHFRDWDLWTLDAEASFRAPLGAVEPFVGLGAGYARLGSLGEAGVRVQGYDIRLNAGIDYYFDKAFSIGGTATAEVLGMTRPGVDLNQSAGSVSKDVYKLDGSSVGIAILASAVVGLHL
jgi:hypothetical protein